MFRWGGLFRFVSLSRVAVTGGGGGVTVNSRPNHGRVFHFAVDCAEVMRVGWSIETTECVLTRVAGSLSKYMR